ncbi:unnamed protein product [Triticum turgidum subsp. durum]|uniref:Glycosyltransferase n=1 Tax=Triticum turgidum subsp. durum TaxID=4567 RepID=A0A9R0Z880_TRITD|nr:unnamed protein product [Triticum turgidum subsp. durum]
MSNFTLTVPSSLAMASTKHVLLFPFPAQGHLGAFMSLAELLHRAIPSAAVTLVSPPRNVAALSATAPPWLAFHSLPFNPADHGLPTHAESADALPVGFPLVTLFEAFEALQPAFDGYVASMAKDDSVVSIVSDLFVAWAASVARRNGCSHAFFASCGAFGTAILRSLWENVPLSVTPTGHVPVPGFPGKIFHKTQVSEVMLRADGEDRASAFCHRQIAHSHATDGVLINTVEEFEPTGLGLLRSSLRVPVWPIGPLIRVAGARPAASADKVHDGMVSWLDTQPPASVLYVSFGSQNSIRQAQMAVLAMALEHAGRPFIWAIRPPVGLAVAASEWLPEGFEKRARDENRGLVIRGWAPQVTILAHRSTGAFLSHCGWNSVLESLVHGVPLLGWPLAADQFYNVEMLEKECGVCVEVARGSTENAAPPEIDRVAELVETVMGQTSKAAEMRRRMKCIGELMRGAATGDVGSSKKALESFLGATRMH